MRQLRLLGLGVSMAVLVQGPLRAQSAGVAGGAACGGSSLLVGAVSGSAIGSFVGLVVSKIRLSDWDNASRGSSGTRVRNQSLIGGAVIGAALGSVVGRVRSCGGGGRGARMPTRRAVREITFDEIQKAGPSGSVYDLVASLRGNWLVVRGNDAGVSEGPAAYVNETRVGGVAALRDIPAAGITGVRFYDATQATMRWGAGHFYGAIQILTAGAAPGS